MRAEDLLAWLASLPPSERDAAVEEQLGIGAPAPSASVPGDHLVGYHASGVASIVRMAIEVPIAADDVVIDIGAGLGKVVLLLHLLTGATARGIELQPSLVHRARAAAARSGAEVSFTEGDARSASIDDGTVFFLYLPFTGPVLTEILERLRAVASRRAIVVCSLGIDLGREARWLVRRPIDSFWLEVYDSVDRGVAPRGRRDRCATLGPFADAIAFERPGRSQDESW